jgi:hypothetical protein
MSVVLVVRQAHHEREGYTRSGCYSITGRVSPGSSS